MRVKRRVIAIYQLRKGVKDDIKEEEKEKRRKNLNLYEYQVKKLEEHPEPASKLAREIFERELGENDER